MVNGFISFVTSIPKKVVDIFKGIGSTIKGIFNFVIDLPKIKLPHFNVTPKGWKIGDLLSALNSSGVFQFVFGRKIKDGVVAFGGVWAGLVAVFQALKNQQK